MELHNKVAWAYLIDMPTTQTEKMTLDNYMHSISF